MQTKQNRKIQVNNNGNAVVITDEEIIYRDVCLHELDLDLKNYICNMTHEVFDRKCATTPRRQREQECNYLDDFAHSHYLIAAVMTPPIDRYVYDEGEA